tara:strand:- start:103 stop:927 length:825 start_codon:yes stop_codon:yes gene_type:complete
MAISRIKNFLKFFFIQIILKKIKKNYYFKSYPDYKTALAYADGYEDENLTKVVVAKTVNFKKELMKSCIVDASFLKIFTAISASLKNNKLKVLDFGGAAGAHYFIVKSLLDKDTNLDWRVVETPKMKQESIKNQLENSELSFYDNLSSAHGEDKIDLIVAIGSIHYTENPKKTLKELIKINPSYLYLSRTPLAEKEIVLLQESSYEKNGIGNIPEELNIDDKKIKYPVTILNRKEIENIMKDYGKSLITINEDRAAYKSKYDSYDLFGYLIKKY